jgi:serine/threonine-protein kinase
MKRCPSCATVNSNDAAFCIQCGFPLAAVPAQSDVPQPRPGPPEQARPMSAGPPAGYLPAGTVIDGKYEIERVLGEGGMGVVYLARDVHTETRVVVKSIRAELADRPELRARTLAEGRALARIDHPNVVRLNAVVVEPRGLYLVMQFIDGEPLDRLIARWAESGSFMPITLVLTIFRMILQGVGAAHAEGLIHRDLKPANVLIRAKDGVAKVTDFGIAKGEEDAKAGRGMTRGIIGSLAYMAPEQVRGQRDLDKRVDIYALGIVLFELLTGRVPFEAPSDYELMRMHAEMPIPPAGALRPDMPPALEVVLSRACAKERFQRFGSTDEFLQALEGIESAALAQPAAPGAGPVVRAGTGTQVATEVGQPPFFGQQPIAGPAPIPEAWPDRRDGRRGMTDEGAAIPLKGFGQSSSTTGAPRRTGLFIGAGVVAIAALATGVVFYLGQGGNDTKRTTNGGTEATQTTATASSTAPRPADSPLAALVGHWRSNSNRDYTAVLVGDKLEFHIDKGAQHPRQGYEDGDVRFAFSAVSGSPSQFTVTDYIRPTPPPGYEYDAKRSRESCLGTFTQVKGHPLAARYDGGSTVSLELALIRTGTDKFKMQGTQVIGCVDVGSSAAQTIESQLTRTP